MDYGALTKKPCRPNITKLLSWVAEAKLKHQDWRKESWQDYEFRDGLQWPELAAAKLRGNRIRPITTNKIFPIVNYILGHYINNQQDIVAKGRTKEDSELSQVISEAIAFVRDQNKGSQKIIRAVADQLTAGIGIIKVGA